MWVLEGLCLNSGARLGSQAPRQAGGHIPLGVSPMAPRDSPHANKAKWKKPLWSQGWCPEVSRVEKEGLGGGRRLLLLLSLKQETEPRHSFPLSIFRRAESLSGGVWTRSQISAENAETRRAVPVSAGRGPVSRWPLTSCRGSPLPSSGLSPPCC